MRKLVRSKLRLYYERLGREIDVLYAFLLLVSKTQFLPEMYEVFGKRVLKFLEVFGGQRIEVPTREELEGMAEKVELWCDWEEGVGEEGLAEKYGKTVKEVRSILEEVCMRLETLGVRVERWRMGNV